MMMTVIAGNNITPENKDKLISFARENDATVSYNSNGGMRIECKTLKTAAQVSKKVREMRKK